jgi:4'-phosphopantetheinyl transferase
MSEGLYWLAQNLSEMPESNDWLSEGERLRVAEMRFPKRRNDYKLGRWTAKRAISAYLQNSIPRDSLLDIRAAVDGSPDPYFDGKPGNFSLSISHSNQRSLCAVGPRDLMIGCDLELIESRAYDFLADYFTPEELAFVKQNSFCAPPQAGMLIWSSKESALKVLREGLRRDTRSILIQPDFDVQEGRWNPWTGGCLETSQIFYGWWRVSDNFVYTIAADRPSSPPIKLRIQSK